MWRFVNSVLARRHTHAAVACLTTADISRLLQFKHRRSDCVHAFLVDCRKTSQRKIAAGAALKRKGRPPKDYAVGEQDKVAELKYILARKDAQIKRLEMENELMRDFLSETEGM